MNAVSNLLQTIRIYDITDPALELIPQAPQQPQTPDDLIGVEIVFTHTNRFLFPDYYTGTVTAHRYCTSRSNPEGWLELKVKSPNFSLEKWVHEDNFVCYCWELPQAATAAVTAL